MDTRKQNRLQGYNYSRMGYYFVTICTKNREHFLGTFVGGDVLIAPHIALSTIGKIVDDTIAIIPTVDKYVIMPNHIHVVFRVPAPGNGPMGTSAPTESIPMIVRFLKRNVTMACGFSIWQRGYYDHIIRSEADYLRIWHYIDTNPAKWREDCYYEEDRPPMPKPKDDKTNVMRLLDQRGIPYTPHTYPHEEGVAVDGVTVARTLGLDPETVFKTLLSRGASGAVRVFVLPVGDTLDLKKAAKAAGEKSIEMVHVKEITALSGYVRGGCSPVGMKKLYPTVFHETAEIIDTITVSAGKIGYQVTLSPAALLALVEGTTADIVV